MQPHQNHGDILRKIGKTRGMKLYSPESGDLWCLPGNCKEMRTDFGIVAGDGTNLQWLAGLQPQIKQFSSNCLLANMRVSTNCGSIA